MHALLFTLSMLSVTESAPSAQPHAPERVDGDVGSERNQALMIAAAGVGFAVVSAVSFTTGLDAERELRATRHDEASADALLNKRTIAAWVAYPTAVLALAGLGAGGAMLALPSTDRDGAP